MVNSQLQTFMRYFKARKPPSKTFFPSWSFQSWVLPYSSQQSQGIHNCPVKALACRSSPPSYRCGPDAGSNVEALWGKKQK